MGNELRLGHPCRLEAADGNILEDMGLVEGLEATKATAANVEDRVAEARVRSSALEGAFFDRKVLNWHQATQRLT